MDQEASERLKAESKLSDQLKDTAKTSERRKSLAPDKLQLLNTKNLERGSHASSREGLPTLRNKIQQKRKLMTHEKALNKLERKASNNSKDKKYSKFKNIIHDTTLERNLTRVSEESKEGS